MYACKYEEISNGCAKIKSVDTCMCGRGHECDATGVKSRCVDSYGEQRPGDVSLTCQSGKYLAWKIN